MKTMVLIYFISTRSELRWWKQRIFADVIADAAPDAWLSASRAVGGEKRG